MAYVCQKSGLLLAGILLSGLVCFGMIRLNCRSLTMDERAGGAIAVDSLTPANITLPQTVEDTGLVAKALCLYDGTFRENGRNEEVFGVTALLVENTTGGLVTSAEICLQKDEEMFSFYVQMLPPGATALVPEKSGKSTPIKNFTQCTGWAETESGEVGAVSVVPSGMGSYIVQNLTDREIASLSVWHKDYLPEADIFIGGYAYCTTLKNIQPGQKVEVYPLGYASAGSRVTAVVREKE